MFSNSIRAVYALILFGFIAFASWQLNNLTSKISKNKNNDLDSASWYFPSLVNAFPLHSHAESICGFNWMA